MDWLSSCSRQSDTVFFEPLGLIGFRLDRRIHDYPAHASPAVTAAIASLHRRVSGKPDDPAVIGSVLDALAPEFVVLREDEFQRVGGVASTRGYRLVHVAQTPAATTVRYRDIQSMFILRRTGDGHAADEAGCVRTAR